MGDWQVGDLAVCVDASPCLRIPFPGAPWKIPQGAVRRVTALGKVDPYTGSLTLMLEGERATCEHHGFGFAAIRFRKIRPDKHEKCEPEFASLLKRRKSPAEHIMDGLGDD